MRKPCNLVNSFCQRGFSLLEIVLATGLMGVLAVLITQVTIDYLAQSMRTNGAVTRDQMVTSLRATAGDLRSLRSSLNQPENTQFHDCVCGGGAPCASVQSIPFNLYDGSGVAQSPTYYDAGGVLCDQNSPSCLIRVQTSFMAQCMPVLPSANPVPPVTCTTPAELVVVIYTVDQNPASLSNSGILRSVRGGVYTQVTDISPLGPGGCPCTGPCP